MSSRSTLAFLKTETGSGVILALAALVAIVWANSPWAGAYLAITKAVVPVQVGPFAETMTVSEWVKTALMPIFFFVVGLETKHEILRGELSNPRRLALPVLAAAGGVIAPALIFLAINGGEGRAPQGWPIPTATDIAFALAALAAAGPRLPPSLRVFLMTLAIADDLVAVILIAVLYTEDLRLPMLAGAAATTAVLAAMGRWRTAPYAFWVVGGLLLWGFTLKSGVNTSLAGVAAAFCLPLAAKGPGRPGVLDETMEALHPYVAFLVLPMFAFTAAGFTFGGPDTGKVVLSAVSLGVAAGLFFGKQLGVFGAALLVISLKWARRPTGAKWIELYGVAALCGVGFTMSLYIGALAFPVADALHQAQVRAGVVMGSLASTLLGVGLLMWSDRRRRAEA